MYLVCAMEETRGQRCLTPVLGHFPIDLLWPRAVRAERSVFPLDMTVLQASICIVLPEFGQEF